MHTLDSGNGIKLKVSKDVIDFLKMHDLEVDEQGVTTFIYNDFRYRLDEGQFVAPYKYVITLSPNANKDKEGKYTIVYKGKSMAITNREAEFQSDIQLTKEEVLNVFDNNKDIEEVHGAFKPGNLEE